MVRIYKSDNDYIVVRPKSIAFSNIQNVEKKHIPFSNKYVIVDKGAERETSLVVFSFNEADKFNLSNYIKNVTKVSFNGGSTYFVAKYVGGSETRRVAGRLYEISFNLILSVEELSSVETVKTADQVLPNSGNHFATPTFEISGEGSGGITISDGVRTLIIMKEITNTDVLKISDWQLLLNGEDISEFLSGDYPRIPESQTNFVFTVTGITPSNIIVKYRETWR